MTSDHEFLTQNGWGSASRDDFPADWSTRHFARLSMNDRTAILMSSVPDSDPRALAGHKIKDFVELSGYLRGIGVHAPAILAQDQDHGFLLVEDFGFCSLHDAFEAQDKNLEQYYLAATDILISLYQKTSHDLPSAPHYFESHVFKGRRRLWDWYLPTIFQKTIDKNFSDESLSILNKIEQSIAPMNNVFLHGDFHPHNLMILPNNDIGVIDFQGGMIGPAPYDLVNLLRDARRFVPDHIQAACVQKFKSVLSPSEWELFESHYALRSFDFHARVIGQAIKLARAGKPKLLTFIPILARYVEQDLDHPLLHPLRDYMHDALGVWPVFTAQLLENACDFISADAF